MDTPSLVYGSPIRLARTAAGTILLTVALAASGQGTTTVTFDQWPSFSRAQNYSEQGVWFHVVSTNGVPVSQMTEEPSGGANGSPYMLFNRLSGTGDYVTISLGSGGEFGVASIDLANRFGTADGRFATFGGYRANGQRVSTTVDLGVFSNFTTYQLGPGFSSGLTRLEVSSADWMMDNLALSVPEPGWGCLFVLGLLALLNDALIKMRDAKTPTKPL